MLTRIRKRSKEIYFGDIRAQLGAYRRSKVSFGDLKTKSAANIVLKTPSSARTQEAREIKTYLSLPSRTRRFLYCYDADFFFFLIKKSFLRDEREKYLTGRIYARLPAGSRAPEPAFWWCWGGGKGDARGKRRCRSPGVRSGARARSLPTSERPCWRPGRRLPASKSAPRSSPRRGALPSCCSHSAGCFPESQT